MLRQFATAFTLAATLAATPAYAADPTGQPGRGGDGHCPIPTLTTDPDCAKEGAQPYQKGDRDRAPRRMGSGMPPGPDGNGPNIPPARRGGFTAEGKCNKSECRDRFPTTTPQPSHLG